MLSIRLQRLGRKGYPTYRVVVQDSRQSPASGKYVALLGSYNPHSKQTTLVRDKAEFYLNHGAQPSERVVALFKSEKISIPKWVAEPVKKDRKIRNPEKLRKNRPADAEPAEKPAETEEPEASKAEEAEKPAETEEPEVTKTDEAEPSAEGEETESAKTEEAKLTEQEAAKEPADEAEQAAEAEKKPEEKPSEAEDKPSQTKDAK